MRTDPDAANHKGITWLIMAMVDNDWPDDEPHLVAHHKPWGTSGDEGALLARDSWP